MRRLPFAIVLLCASCSLAVDLGGLADGAPDPARDGSADGPLISPSGEDAGADVAKEARALPDGAVIFPANGHGYLAVNDAKRWAEARRDALDRGGHLATVTSAGEQSFVLGLLLREFTGPEAWLGGVQVPGSPEPDAGWGWDDGEPMTYTGWAPGDPNNLDAGGPQDCLSVVSEGWWDQDCTVPRAYLVEFE